MVPFSTQSRSPALKSSIFLSENIAIFHLNDLNDDLFTQYLFLNEKKCFDDFFMTTWEQKNKSKRKKEPQIPRLGPHFKMNYSPIAHWRFDGIKNVSRNSFGSFQSKIVESKYEYRKPMNNRAIIFFEILINYILRGMSRTLGLVPWGSLCHPHCKYL